MRNTILRYTFGAIAGLAAACASAQVDHLLLSEIGMNGGPNNEGEYIEIFNPTASAIDLGNYWIADYNNYSLRPQGPQSVGGSDTMARFPEGAMLGSGQVAIVVGKADTFLTNHFGGALSNYTGQAGAPLIFEVNESDGAVPNMRDLQNAGDPTATPPVLATWNFTNASATNGEFAVLFFWDGTANLVKDVDIVSWGDAPTGGNLFAPKTATSPGANGATYVADAGSHTNLTVGDVDLAIRTSITEASEVATGGNGLTGHDETTEANQTSWEGRIFPDQATPGLTNLTVVGANLPPVFNSAERNLVHPSSSQAITLEANVTDADGTVSGVNFFVSTGSGFTTFAATSAGAGNWTANIGTYANGSVINWYAEATDDDSAKTLLPVTAPTSTKMFIIDDQPIMPGDVVINEILYDEPSTDTYEFVEIRNTRSTPINIKLFKFADGNRSYFEFPDDAVIEPNGFIVVTLTLADFQAQFPAEPNVKYYDWGTFGLNNTAPGDDVVLVHPNDFDFNGTTTFIDQVVYGIDEPWPQGVQGSGQSMELINPMLDNALPESWRPSSPAPTPGKENSVFTPISISEVTRNIEFPAASQAVTVTAKVESIVPGVTISQVRLMVDTGSSFAPINMTLTATPGVYTANIPGQSNGATVKYYVEATNSASQTATSPTNAPTDFNVYLVGGTPVASGNVVFNELLYDNFGADAYEFIELHNTTGATIDLSFFRVVDGQDQPFTFPAGTTIGANSYLVITYNDFNFRASYGNPPVPLFTWNQTFNLGNGGDTVRLIHPNQWNFEGPSTALEEITYDTVAPWPNWATPEESPNSTGRSIELINPLSPFRYTGELWGWTTNMVVNDPPNTVVQGTPGAQNSIYSTSAVADWSVY